MTLKIACTVVTTFWLLRTAESSHDPLFEVPKLMQREEDFHGRNQRFLFNSSILANATQGALYSGAFLFVAANAAAYAVSMMNNGDISEQQHSGYTTPYGHSDRKRKRYKWEKIKRKKRIQLYSVCNRGGLASTHTRTHSSPVGNLAFSHMLLHIHAQIHSTIKGIPISPPPSVNRLAWLPP